MNQVITIAFLFCESYTIGLSQMPALLKLNNIVAKKALCFDFGNPPLII